MCVAALEIAVESGRIGAARALLESGALLPSSLLEVAVGRAGLLAGQELALLLVRHGAQPSQVALAAAARLDQTELLEELLHQSGAGPSAEARAGPGCRILLEHHIITVPALTKLARLVIRQAVGRSFYDRLSFPGRLAVLPLPPALTQYVTN